MDFNIYPIALGISVVILSLAVAIVAIIKAKAKHGHPSFMAGLNDLEKAARNKLNSDGLTGRGVPISKEEFKACREKGTFNALIPGIEEAAKAKGPSYREALLVEQLGYRIELSGINLNNVASRIAEYQNTKSQAKKDAFVDNFNAAKEHYCNAFDSAAYWHLQGLISFPVYKEHFLRSTIDIYDDIDIAKNWANIAEIEKRYGKLIRGTEEEPKEVE